MQTIKITERQIDILEHRLSRPSQIAADIAAMREKMGPRYPYPLPAPIYLPEVVASAARLMAGARGRGIDLSYCGSRTHLIAGGHGLRAHTVIDRVVLWDTVDGFEVGPREDWPGLSNQGYTGIKRAYRNLCNKLEAAGIAKIERNEP